MGRVEVKTPKSKDQPLRCEVKDDLLVISIGVDTLAFADAERTGIAVVNPTEFAKDVISELIREEEDGSSPLTDLLDEVMEEAVNHGSSGVEHETEVIINGTLKKVASGFIDYNQLVIASGKACRPDYTVVYAKGWPHDSEGILRNGDKVRIKRGMVVDIVFAGNA